MFVTERSVVGVHYSEVQRTSYLVLRDYVPMRIKTHMGEYELPLVSIGVHSSALLMPLHAYVLQ